MRNPVFTLFLIFAATLSAQTGNSPNTMQSQGPQPILTVPSSGSIQAAIDAAGNNGTVNLTPRSLYNASSTLKIPYSYFIFNANGACILTTSPGDGIIVTGQHVTLNDPCLIPGTASTGAAIHDQVPFEWSQVTINRPHLIQRGDNRPANGHYWYYGIQVDEDELFTVNNWNGPYAKGEFGGPYDAGAYGVLRCDSTFCGSGIYNPAFSLTISSIVSSSSSGPWTFTVTNPATDEQQTPNLLYQNLVGQIVNATATSGGSGDFNAFYTIKAVTSNTTFTATVGPHNLKRPTGNGTAKGGATSLFWNSAVGYVNDSSISMGCSGNPIDWEGGNDLTLKSDILQTYPQFGLRVNKLARGASGNINMVGIHNEPGECPNPALNHIKASAGYIANGGVHLSMMGGGSGGEVPIFPATGAEGREKYAYYAVIHHHGASTTTQPLPIGYTKTANADLSQSNFVTVTAPLSTGFGDTCDFLRVDQYSGAKTVNGRVAPYGGLGKLAIPGEQGILCDPTVNAGFITFADTTSDADLEPYTFRTTGAYGPSLNDWPGTFILTGTGNTQSTYNGSCNAGSLFVVPAYPGITNTSNVTCVGQTIDDWATNPAPYGSVAISRISGLNQKTWVPSALALPMWDGYMGVANVKGLINFGTPYTYAGGATDAITLFDSSPFKTLDTPGNRPGADAGDTSIGLDQGKGNGGLALRDNFSISQYIGHIFDGTSYLERLTPVAKTFRVPVIAPSLSGAGVASFTAGPAAGLSSGTPVCARQHVCDSVAGTIDFRMGASTTTGVLLTVTTGTTRTSEPTCIGTVSLATPPYTSLPIRITETTTTAIFNAGIAPTPSVAYELTYECSGN